MLIPKHNFLPSLPVTYAPLQLTPPPTIAAVTMVYNEAAFLPLWRQHYSAQVGAENCFILDHGSEDGSTRGLANTVRLPRTPYDPNTQSLTTARFCASLLGYYDWVLYADVDEFLLPDPAVAPTLRAYVRRTLPDVVTAIGLNLIHRPDHEPGIDLTRPITTQRPFALGSATMCKPTLIRRPVTWTAGSHTADAAMAFDHLYLFHLHWFDLGFATERLQRTRAMAWARDGVCPQQRMPDDQLTARIRGFANLPTRTEIDFNPETAPIKPFLDAVRTSRNGREQDYYPIDLLLWSQELWQLPQRFIGRF